MTNPTPTAVFAQRLLAVSALCFVPAIQAQTMPMQMPVQMPAPMGAASAGSDMHKNMMGSDGMKKSMMMGMDSMNSMKMTGDTDKDFASMMKIHHQQAVDMAQMELKHGKSPAMKTMAKNIISAQKKEIAQFDQWLAQQK